MIVSIHQPEHFPYLGFFQKMKKSDLFIILDNVKFKKNNFQNRNRFLNRGGNEEWFTVPVEKKANSKLIKDVKMAENHGWKYKLMKQMNINFGLDYDTLEYIYDGDSLCSCNIKSIDYCRMNLDIDTPYILASDLLATGNKTELLVNICKEVGATTYLSGSSGFNYINLELFTGIKVEVFQPQIENYYTTLYNLKENK